MPNILDIYNCLEQYIDIINALITNQAKTKLNSGLKKKMIFIKRMRILQNFVL